MFIVVTLCDHEDLFHKSVKLVFEAEATIQQLQDEILTSFQVAIRCQEIFDRNARRIDLLTGSLQNAGLQDDDTLILKHADLTWWTSYKRCVELVLKGSAHLKSCEPIPLKKCADKVAIAREAVQIHEQLTKNGFFKVYTKFNDYRREKHYKVAAWTDDDVNLIREATKQYFHNRHNKKRGSQESKFVCDFQERDRELGGRITSTMALVQIHGEDLVSKFYVKCAHSGPKGTSSGQPADISELFCYKLLELMGVGPKCHIIPPNMDTGSNTSGYVASKWNEDFVLMEKVIEEKSLSADTVVQLVVLRVLLFISDLHPENCGVWKGTNDAAIVDFAPTNDFKVYPNIEAELFSTFPNGAWKDEYKAVINEHKGNWLKIAKQYLDKWEMSSKIELAHKKIVKTKDLLKILELSFKKQQLRHSPTDQLNDYIDTLYKNLENLENSLCSIVY